jgi:hypothetical protein
VHDAGLGIHTAVAKVYESSHIKSERSKLTGAEIREKLKSVAWSESDFIRFCRSGDRTMRDYMRGVMDGRIPFLIEIALEYVLRHSLELQNRPELRTPIRQSRARQEAAMMAEAREKARAYERVAEANELYDDIAELRHMGYRSEKTARTTPLKG